MRIFQITILLIFTFLSFSIKSQNSYVITGIIKNPEGKVVKDAKVYFSNSTYSFVPSNSKGRYYISINYTKPVELVITHAAHQQKKILLNKSVLRKAKQDTLTINVTLKYRTLKTKVIYAKEKPAVVFGSKITSVADYQFIPGGMILLSYQKSLKKNGFLQLTSKDNTLITQYKTPPNPQRLFKDFENRIYLITKYKVYNISIVKNEFRLRPVDKKEFYGITTRIIDTTENHFLYSNFNPDYPAFNYYAQKMNDTSAKAIHYVENTFMMDLYRAEYKYAPSKQKLWAYRQELVTGIDKEIWIGASNFTQSIYYEPLYAPLIVNNDTTLIFDHYSDYLIKFDKDFNKMDSVPIAYHKDKERKNWEQPIVKDKEEHKIYGLFLKNGFYYLKPINLADGTTLVSYKLAYKYVENVKVENGYVYYIYRPYESAQKKFLYREIIRVD